MSLGAPLGTTEVIFCGQKRSICLMAKKRVKIGTVKSYTVSGKNLPSNQSYGSSSLDDPVSTHNFPPTCISVTKENI